MGEPPMPSTTNTIFPPSPPRPFLPVPVSLIQPSQKKRKRPTKFFRLFQNIFRSFPVFTPVCKFPTLANGLSGTHRTTITGSRVTGTLFGYRKGRVTLCVQETPRCFPTVVVELAMQTSLLQKEMSLGMVRIALECEKRVDHNKEKLKLIQEPVWAMYCNGKKTGYCFKRDATEEDLMIMELLRPVSMGAGVLPGNSELEGTDGELAYMRAHFEHVAGSKDSETLYMFSPLGNNGPELSIFFVRV